MVDFSYYKALEAECRTIREDYERRYPIEDFFSFVPDLVLFERCGSYGRAQKANPNYLGSFDEFRYLPAYIPKIKRPKYLLRCPRIGDCWEYLFKDGRLRYVLNRGNGRRYCGVYIVTDTGFYQATGGRLEQPPSDIPLGTYALWYIDPSRKRYITTMTGLDRTGLHYEDHIQEAVLSPDEAKLDFYEKYSYFYSHTPYERDGDRYDHYLYLSNGDSKYFVRSQCYLQENPITGENYGDELVRNQLRNGFIEVE